MLKEFVDMKKEYQKSKSEMKVEIIYKTMLSHCLNCRKKTKIKNPKSRKGIMLLSKCALCESKKMKFIKERVIWEE